METSTKSKAINLGLILGAILALYVTLCYVIDLNLFTNIWLGFIEIALKISFGIFAIIQVKKLLEGYISFKNAFTAYFITIVIGLIISAIVSYVLFDIIDVEASKTLQQLAIEKQIQFAKRFGADNESISVMVDQANKQDSSFSLSNMLLALGMQILGYSIVGLIIALIMKKPKENQI
jgi:hypothetical protein